MALTSWPDFSKANLTDWEPVEALIDAIRERVNVLRCVHLPSRASARTISPSIVPVAMRRDVSNIALFDSIRTAICSLAAFYVDPDNEDWHNAGCTRDAPVFGYASPLRVGAAHSLSALPDVAACEADPDALAAYRTFLANAAWWLDAFRYVDASERAVYDSKLEMWVSTLTEDWSEITDALDEPTITTPSGGYPLRTTNRYGNPSGLLLALDEQVSLYVRKNDPYPPRISGHTPHPDDWQAGSRVDYYSGKATCYDALSVSNPSPLDANVVLLPLADKHYRTVNRRMTGAVEFKEIDGGGGYGHYWLHSYNEYYSWELWIGDGFKLDTSNENSVTLLHSDWTETEYSSSNTVYHNSPDGTVVEHDTTTDSGSGAMSNWCNYPEAKYEETLRTFDAFGTEAELGVPLDMGTVAAARSTISIEFWSHSGKIPLADGWADRPTDAQELSAPGPQTRRLDFDLYASIGFAVLFDFGPYFTHGGSDAEH